MDELNGMGWTKRYYFADQSAWPQDWMETSIVASGLDKYISDGSDTQLAVWSGHGVGAASEPNGAFSIAFGYPHDGMCYVSAPGLIFFGERGAAGWGNDGNNQYVIVDACCSMVLGEMRTVWQNWGPGIMMGTDQAFGFHSETDDSADRIEAFVRNVRDGQSNMGAWLDVGEDCFLFWCSNSPVVLTHGADQADAYNRHHNESLKWVWGPAPGRGGYYYWNWIDNGGC
jgi:hypothetical protein